MDELQPGTPGIWPKRCVIGSNRLSPPSVPCPRGRTRSHGLLSGSSPIGRGQPAM
jgi:hypothetical protein